MVQKIAPGSAWEDTGFVFTKPNGTPLDPERVSKEFSKVVKTAKIPKIRFHDLRHTHASLMLKAGVGPKAISELLGHASISITMDVYAHLIPGIQEEAAQKFSNLLAAPRKGKS
jgi:integrase|tara:strand:- start:145 stop:486 length:342 start_codon:yes stop_codon:yes gene_type:complete